MRMHDRSEEGNAQILYVAGVGRFAPARSRATRAPNMRTPSHYKCENYIHLVGLVETLVEKGSNVQLISPGLKLSRH